MGAVAKLEAQVRDAEGAPVGVLTIQLPGGRARAAESRTTESQGLNPEPLLDLRGDLSADPSLEPLRLLEGAEYRYVLRLEPVGIGPVTLEPAELIWPDSDDWLAGRLRPGLSTGVLAFRVLAGERELGRVNFEVRSRKLDYLSRYRWMLENVADDLAELLMERFAPSELRFKPAESVDAQTLYERFAFLKSLFSGPTFEASLHQILSNPHRAWVEETELRRPGQPVPMSSRVAREVGRPGPRVPLPVGSMSVVPSLPTHLRVTRTDETLDTPENRFLKFVFLQWREFVNQVEEALDREGSAAPARRGLREVRAVLDRLDELLASDLFFDVGRLSQFPAGSQVLQKRAGYRDIYRAYLQSEAAAQLTWEGGQDVYGAGQRDVAALYEYWVFLQLVKVMERLCGREFDRSQLFERGTDGMGVALKRGRSHPLKGSVSRLGRRLQLELWFNRTFSHRPGNRSSWTRPMRPDYSILIRPDSTYGAEDEVWVHFDAKYRVERLVELFGRDPSSEVDEKSLLDEEEAPAVRLAATRSDLLKMHAYRDAIHRSAGAYVIYPGIEAEQLRTFHELLPGLGAFALRPTQDGLETGINAIYRFMDDVITHLTTQTTQHERTRFWVRETTAPASYYPELQPKPATALLPRPPADTLVLLGYVRTPEQLDWIRRHKRYNLRADPARRGAIDLQAKELAADFVLLYGERASVAELWRVVGAPEILTHEDMFASGYPEPHGPYFCLPLEEAEPVEWIRDIKPHDVMSLARSFGSRGRPVAVRWLDLALR